MTPQAIAATALLYSQVLVSSAYAWSPTGQLKAGNLFQNAMKTNDGRLYSQLNSKNSLQDDELGAFFPDMGFDLEGKKTQVGLGALGLSSLLYHPLIVEAADKVAEKVPVKVPVKTVSKIFIPAKDALPSAIAAYVHYASLFTIVGAIMIERVIVRPYMPPEDEETLALADITLGVSGIALLVSGYYRATLYGKGWDFYANEPLFWAKMTALGVFGALSLFPTITFIKRSVLLRNEPENWQPMSENLASRLVSILNAELSAMLFIPLLATTMSRGIGYLQDFPTQIVGPIIFGFVTFGTCYKYVNDAFSWQEDWEMNSYDDNNYYQQNNDNNRY